MATSIIKLHTFSGASDGKPPCFILQIDQFHCMFDCGWEEGMDLSHLQELSKWIKYLDAVFISHATPRHCGLLPHLVGHYGLSCPIYSTIPTAKLGQLFLYDIYQSIYSSEDFNFFSLDDIDLAFSKFTQLKYQQAQTLQGRGQGISVMPYSSGYILGGTIWKIFKEDTEIVYAIDFNHKKERHLNGAAFDACMKPYLLIMDASNALYTQPKRKDRDDYLRQICLKTLSQGGNVLIATDSAGRCLEIAHYLEAIWHATDAGLMAYGLSMLSNVAFNVFDYAKNLIEWMSEKVIKSFEEQRANPFIFKHMQLCHTLDQFDMVLSPKVVLASMDDLRYGFARQLFAEWSSNPENSIIITKQIGNDIITKTTTKDDIIAQLYQNCSKSEMKPGEERDLINVHENNFKIPFTINQRVMVPAEKYDKSAPLPFLDGNEEKEENGDHPQDGSNAEKSDKNELIKERTRGKRKRKRVQKPATSDYSSTSTSDSDLDSGDEFARKSSLKRIVSEQDVESREIPEKITTENIPLIKGRHQHGYDILRSALGNDGGLWFKTAKNTVLAFTAPEKVIQFDDYGEPLTQDFRLAMSRGNAMMMAERAAAQSQKNAAYKGRFRKNSQHGGGQNGEKGHPSGDGSATGGNNLNSSFDGALVPKGEKSAKLSNSMKFILNSDDKLLLNMFTQNSLASGINISDWLQMATRSFEKSREASKDAESGEDSDSLLSPNKTLQNMFISKCISHEVELEVKMKVYFIDYECRSDGEAIKKIVNGIRPQELILVGNDRASVDHLADYCRNSSIVNNERNKQGAKGAEKSVHIPQGVDVVNCTKEDFIYQAKMADGLVSSLRLTKIKDYELAWVDAALSIPNNSAETIRDSTDDTIEELGPVKTIHQQVNKLPTLVPLTSNKEHLDHGTVLVNEPKMSDLKQLFKANGLSAEFFSGILVVGECVSIKRMDAGKLSLEGKLSDTYFTVRKLLYQQFAVL